jgi:uridine phosphorylase
MVHEAATIRVVIFIRMGSTCTIEQGIKCDDLVISSAMVRLDGASQSYVLPKYPAHTNYEILMALLEAAEGLDVRYQRARSHPSMVMLQSSPSHTTTRLFTSK